MSAARVTDEQLETERLTTIVERRRKNAAIARATEAVVHLRKACELVAELDTDPDAVRAAEHMTAAADILDNFKPDEW